MISKSSRSREQIVILIEDCGILAQLGEHLPYKQGVTHRKSESIYGGVAQLARACGSYPQCQEFESPLRYVWEAFAGFPFL